MIRLLLVTAIVSSTVHTGEGPPLEDAVVLIEGNRIAAVGHDVVIPQGARMLDAAGAVVTPGLIDAASRLAGIDMAALHGNESDLVTPGWLDAIRAPLRVEDAFDAHSPAVARARAGGLTSLVVIPTGGFVSGQSAWVDLVSEQPVRRSPLALHVSLAASRARPGHPSLALMRLRELLEDARLFRANRGPYISRRLRDLSASAADLEVLARALDGSLPVVFEVDRASAIRAVLRIVREYRLEAVLLGAEEGWLVADELAQADIPVLVDPLAHWPSRARPRSRADNALRLQRAGVKLAFTMRGPAERAHRLRHAAGNAVANGYPYDAALAAITRVPADVFGGTDAGRIRPGALANVVVWNGDPLELDSWPIAMFVRGAEVELD